MYCVPWRVCLPGARDLRSHTTRPEDKLAEALHVLAAADAQWGAFSLRREPKGSLEGLLQQLDFYDTLLMGLWAEGDDEKKIRHPAELSEAACLHHVRDRQLCKDVRGLVSGTRMARRAVLWGFRKPWLRHGKGPPWKAALLAPLPLRFLRSRWLEASCLVKLHAKDVGGAKLQKAVKSWQMAGRDISARWHGFAIPNSKVLKILKSCSSGGLVELGAGVGYWATLLKRRGATFFLHVVFVLFLQGPHGVWTFVPMLSLSST